MSSTCKCLQRYEPQHGHADYCPVSYESHIKALEQQLSAALAEPSDAMKAAGGKEIDYRIGDEHGNNVWTQELAGLVYETMQAARNTD